MNKGEVLRKVVFEAGVIVNAPAPTGSITLKVEGRLLQLDPIARKILDIFD